MSKFITSRGRLQELRTAEVNIACSAQHMYDVISDKANISEDEKSLITVMNKARMSLRKQYLPNDYDVKYHCMDKHLLMARMQHHEAMESIVRTGGKVSQDMIDTQTYLDEASTRAFALLLGISQKDLESEGCPKCLDDFLENDSKPKKPEAVEVKLSNKNE